MRKTPIGENLHAAYTWIIGKTAGQPCEMRGGADASGDSK
jgi:hypothetical protein